MIGYSRVVVRGDSAWVSGCTSVVDGEVRHPGDVAAQAREAFANLASALQRAGFTLADVVRTRMYLTDIRPATAMIGVSALLDPAMLVEIEADAVREGVA
jgi:enamine deaminase RidA (YjgF/YER057c/UK114 family)